jgi:hypothetical protein
MNIELKHLVRSTNQPKELSFSRLKRRIRHHVQQAYMKSSNGLMRRPFFGAVLFPLAFQGAQRKADWCLL